MNTIINIPCMKSCKFRNGSVFWQKTKSKKWYIKPCDWNYWGITEDLFWTHGWISRDNVGSSFFSLYWNVTLSVLPPQWAVAPNICQWGGCLDRGLRAAHSGFLFGILCVGQWIITPLTASAHPKAACFSQISQEPTRLRAMSADPQT